MKDIGRYKVRMEDILGVNLSSQEAYILHDIWENIGPNQVTSCEIVLSQRWVVEKGMYNANDENWKVEYTEVTESGLLGNENNICPHVVIKDKTNDGGILKLKGRIVLHGNRDAVKGPVRREFEECEMLVVSMVVSWLILWG